MSDTKHIVCPSCNAVNRIPVVKMNDNPTCGKCHKQLFNGDPVTLNAKNFQQNIKRNDIPVVVDFWAPWCGPCKTMEPAFKRASIELMPDVRLAKLNTENEQGIAGQLNIRSIPTMIMFVKGQEVARQAGAMSSTDIKSWVKSHL